MSDLKGMEMLEGMAWKDCGRVIVTGKKPRFPAVDSVPGLYRLTLDNGWLYFGEAKDLHRRLGDYEVSNSGIVQEHRLFTALVEAGGARVEVLTEGDVSVKGVRCAIEAELVRNARLAGSKVLNGSQAGDPYCIGLDIRWHQSEVQRLQLKLDSMSK